jgi:hypothetical protein
MITVNSLAYKQYEAGGLTNVAFYNASGTQLNSWLESGNSNTSTNTVYWVKLPNGIPASSSITIYMRFYQPLSNTQFNSNNDGEAPQLSPTYAQYDDGASVFPFYDNFAGTSLNTNKWASYGSISVSNGVTVNGGSSYAYLISSSGFNPTSTIADFFVTSASSRWPVISMTNGNSASSTGYFSLWGGTSYTFYAGSYSGGISGSGGYTWNYPAILSENWQSSSQQIYGSNYIFTTESYNTYALPSSVYYGFGSVATSSSGTISIQWMRARAYPPNGVMPSVSFGSLSHN